MKKSFFGLVWKIRLGDSDSGSDKTRLLVSPLHFSIKSNPFATLISWFFPHIFINCTLTWKASSTCVWLSSGVDHPVFCQTNLCCFERLAVINQDSCRGFMLLWTLGSVAKHPKTSPPLPLSKCDWQDDSPFPPLWKTHSQSIHSFAARVISVSGWTIAQYRSPVQEVFLPFLP